MAADNRQRERSHGGEQDSRIPFQKFCGLLILLNIIMFILTMKEAQWKFADPSINPLIGPTGDVLVRMGAKVTPLILDGQWWRLISSMFLQGGVVHLVLNMAALWNVGFPLEDQFGPFRVAVVYFAAGLTGNLTSAIFLPSQITVGASGAIFGLFGATWAEFLQNWEDYKGERCDFASRLLFSTCLSLAIGLVPLIDNFAHVGGFVGGLLCGLVFMAESAHIEAYRDGSIHHRPDLEGGDSESNVRAPLMRREDGSDPRGQCCCCVCSVRCWRQAMVGIVALGTLLVLIVAELSALYEKVDPRQWCSFCDYINCVDTKWWDCNADSVSCEITGPYNFPQKGWLSNITCTNGDIIANISDAQNYIQKPDKGASGGSILFSPELCTDCCTGSSACRLN